MAVPPWATAMDRTIDSPRPDPWPIRSRPSPRRNGWKNPAMSDSATWGPVLRTTSSAHADSETSTDPPGTL